MKCFIILTRFDTNDLYGTSNIFIDVDKICSFSAKDGKTKIGLVNGYVLTVLEEPEDIIGRIKAAIEKDQGGKWNDIRRH